MQNFENGRVLLPEGATTDLVYVLAEGRIEILRGSTQVTVLDEPGALVGEMSILLGIPHTATARALGDVKVHVVERAAEFFRTHPELSWLVAQLLASRLNAATTYLVDLNIQVAPIRSAQDPFFTNGDWWI